MSQKSRGENSSDSNSSDMIEVRSPYRPYPLAAKKELREAVDELEFPTDDPRCAFVNERPPQSILDDYELTVVRTDDPDEVWETKTGDVIRIYSDRVEQNGRELSLDPDEAKQKAAAQDHFTLITEENNPD